MRVEKEMEMTITKEMIEAFAKSFYGVKGPQMVIEIGPEIKAALEAAMNARGAQ